MKVALVHDWLTGMRGGEYVLEAIAELFPTADLYTLIHDPKKVNAQTAPNISKLKIHTSFLQSMPGALQKYRHYLPLLPTIAESIQVKDCDLMISSSHCVAKGVPKPKGAVHVSYIHAPMRYMWFRFDDYFGPGKSSLPVRLAAKSIRPYLKRWDRRSSARDRVDCLLANSQYIAQKIKESYGRSAKVIYPFANLERFERLHPNPQDYYFIVSAFAPYKRIDLAVEAFNKLGLPLVIVGGGQDQARLRSMAGPNIRFLGQISNDEVDQWWSGAKALIFPGEEDFGITPLESMASGVPVIAYGSGGACETITPQTGILFPDQSVDSLIAAIKDFEGRSQEFSLDVLRARARQFTKHQFQQELLSELQSAWTYSGKKLAEFDRWSSPMAAL